MQRHATARTMFIARLPRLAGHGLVSLYRYTLAGLIGPRCRHLPSCSEYADEAIDAFRSLGGRLDGAGAHFTLPSVGHIRA